MSSTPTKRRKMRPNNAIAMAKLDKARLNSAQSVSATDKESGIVAHEKTDSNAEKNAKHQAESGGQAGNKSGIKRIRRKSLNNPPLENDTDNAPKTFAQQKGNTPKPVVYSSASDSDETDDEKRSQNATRTLKAPQIEKAAVISESDSDETDEEQKKRRKKQKVNKVTRKTQSAPLSDSDSDETDKEQRSLRVEKQKKDTLPQSDSDSDSSGRNQSDSIIKPKNRSHLSANRISFRRTQEYNDSLSAADNVKNRLSDLFVPEVNDDYFISDSESETDSGEDYDNKQYSSWQRTLSAGHDKNKDPWPKQRKLGYSDKLKLEKRVKKICRREGITFSQVREIFSSSHRGEHLRFFQKIGKVFPDMSLHRLAKLCKEMYHEKRNMGPWTEDEIQKLEELLKIHGNNPTAISEYINRSPKNISDYLYNHKKAPKKVNTKWTKEEDEILAREAAKVIKKDGKISFHTIEPLFKGKRTQKQIHTRYQTLKNLIQPDGTIAEKRKATEYEELRYLKRLLNQVREHRLVEESQLDFAKDRGFVHPKFYLRNRAMIKGFESMSIKNILKTLIEKQRKIIESRKEEKLLESEPESD